MASAGKELYGLANASQIKEIIALPLENAISVAVEFYSPSMHKS